MKKLYFLLISVFAFFSWADAQTFVGEPVNTASKKSLAGHFTQYQLFRIDATGLKSFLRAARGTSDFQLSLPGTDDFNLHLVEDDILAANYTLTLASASGKTIFGKPECITYKGLINGDVNSRVRLTITDGIIYGMIRKGGKEYFIEPLHYLERGEEANVFAVYDTKDVIWDTNLKCGLEEVRDRAATMRGPEPPQNNAGLNCVRTELAIASDNTMFTRYGSAAAVQTHNIGVVNNIMWDYVNAQFNNNIEFVIVTQNVSANPSTDQTSPLVPGNDANELLTNFRTWGEGGNFGVAYDLATLWTVKDISTVSTGTGVIGLAYVGVVCTDFRYQLLEDFAGSIPSGSGFNLRVLTSHETGHNFSANHDATGSPFIMAPTVQNTTIWSPASISSVDGHVGTRTCLAQCSANGQPAQTDFIASPSAICAGGQISFTDRTLGGPQSWSWTFSGGTPATSSARNPSVVFATAGFKVITLTTNNGNGPSSKTGFITVAPAPVSPACSNSGTLTTNAGIQSFNLANISKVTGGSAADGNKYQNFICTDNTQLIAGTAYTASAQVGTTNPANTFNNVNFYIDYNNDGDFLDANETVYQSTNCYIGTHTFNFTTIAAPPVTNVLLRARLIAPDCAAANSCSNVNAGQVEDYGVIFLNIVPVRILELTGKHGNGVNLLEWKVSADSDADVYEIQRSTDSRTFAAIGTKDADAFTAPTQYDFTDDLLNAGRANRFYYRLKVKDRQARITYSDVIALDRNIGGTFTMYPNPVRRGSQFTVSLTDQKATGFEVFNGNGARVYSERLRGFNFTTGFIVPSSWAPGQYLVRVNGAAGPATQKLVIY